MAQTRDAVLQSAKAYWTLGTGGGSGAYPLTRVGTIQLNYPPQGIAANPGGTMAVLASAYFNAGTGLSVSGSQITVYLRARDPAGLWSYGLLAKRGGHDILNYNLFSVDLAGTAGPDIGFEIHTATGLFMVSFPVSQINATGWLDLLGRYDGTTLELFCNGQLMAQTNATGALTQNSEPTLIGAETEGPSIVRSFTGQMEEAAIWERALSDSDMALVSRRPVVRRSPTVPIHFKHPDHPVGDVRPHFINGEYFLTYLYNPGTWNCGILRSTDLVNWTPVQPTHTAPSGIQLLPNYYLLSVIYDPAAGNYRSYYGYSGMRASISTNRIDWDFANPQLQIPPHPALYARESDPYVFSNETTGNYWMVMTLRKNGLPDQQAGAVGYATSPDLKTWTFLGDLYFPGNVGDPECPSMFRMGTRWYLLASFYNQAVGKPSYRVSDNPTGPWTSKVPDSLDGKDLCAAVTCFTGTKRLLFGWIPLQVAYPGSQYWGGHMGLPHEVFPLPDGALGTQLETDLGQRIRGESWFPYPPVSLHPRQQSWTVSGTDARFNDLTGYGVATFTGGFDRVDIQMNVKMTGTARYAGVILDWSESSAGFEVTIDRSNQRLVIASTGTSIHAELPIHDVTDQAVPLRVVVEEDMVELFCADRYALVARLPKKFQTTSLGLVAASGPVDFSQIHVYRLRSREEVPPPGPPSTLAGWEFY